MRARVFPALRFAAAPAPSLAGTVRVVVGGGSVGGIGDSSDGVTRWTYPLTRFDYSSLPEEMDPIVRGSGTDAGGHELRLEHFVDGVSTFHSYQMRDALLSPSLFTLPAASYEAGRMYGFRACLEQIAAVGDFFYIPIIFSFTYFSRNGDESNPASLMETAGLRLPNGSVTGYWMPTTIAFRSAAVVGLLRWAPGHQPTIIYSGDYRRPRSVVNAGGWRGTSLGTSPPLGMTIGGGAATEEPSYTSGQAFDPEPVPGPVVAERFAFEDIDFEGADASGVTFVAYKRQPKVSPTPDTITDRIRYVVGLDGTLISATLL